MRRSFPVGSRHSRASSRLGRHQLRRMLLAEWQAGPEAWSPWAREIFAELGLDEEAGGWRPLVESQAFLALLREEEPAAAAA